jgi:hypothetical protein
VKRSTNEYVDHGRRALMASFDSDVVTIGSGSAEASPRSVPWRRHRVGVMESRRRWKDEDLPKSQWHLPDFLWFPAAELYRIPRTVERLWQRRFVSRFQ